jgi:hypothetical protein
MNLDDFIENGTELGVVALESEQLKEINGGIGGPAGSGSGWKVEAYHMYLIYGEGCYSC